MSLTTKPHQILTQHLSELTIKVINTEDPTNFMYLRDCPQATKHVSFDPSGTYVAASCTNGVIYIYSLSTTEPVLVRKVEDVIRVLETKAEGSSRVAWHPDGRAFAVPTAARDVQVISSADGEKQRAFSSGHTSEITSLAWSPNGALLATAGADRKLLLWETRAQKVLASYDYPDIINIDWHSHLNLLAFSTSDGEIFMFPDVVPAAHVGLLTEETLHPAPFIHDPLRETSHNVGRKAGLTNGLRPGKPNGSENEDPDLQHRSRRRRSSADTLDGILPSDIFGDEEEDFVVDDDGAGYALNENGKRTNRHLGGLDGRPMKRLVQWEPRLHEPLQTGSTPWRGDRRYLCKPIHGQKHPTCSKTLIYFCRFEPHRLRLDGGPGHAPYCDCRVLRSRAPQGLPFYRPIFI